MTSLPVPASQPRGIPVVARTVALDDPGALLALLPDTADPRELASWVRRGEGLVGWGRALEFTAHGPDRFAHSIENTSHYPSRSFCDPAEDTCEAAKDARGLLVSGLGLVGHFGERGCLRLVVGMDGNRYLRCVAMRPLVSMDASLFVS